MIGAWKTRRRYGGDTEKTAPKLQVVETDTFLQASFIAADAQVMLDREISGEMNFRSLIVIPFDGDSMERDPLSLYRALFDAHCTVQDHANYC